MALWIQVAAVVAAVGAAVAALAVSALDRRNSRRIADEDRRAALKHARLMFELEALLRLSQNLRRGGHSDDQISQDMGAEASALIAAIGPHRLPRLTKERVPETRDELVDIMTSEADKHWLRGSIKTHLALTSVVQEIEAEAQTAAR